MRGARGGGLAGVLVAVLVAAAPAVGAAQGSGPVIFRGARTAVRFDVSPPLADLAQLPPPVTVTGRAREKDPPSGLEGPLGPQDVDPLVRPRPVSPPEIPVPSISFDAFNGAGPVPPDPVGAIGRNHYVAMANVQYAVYSRSGTLLAGPANNNTLWAGFGGPCQDRNDGDPIVLYDRRADRWLLTQFTADLPAPPAPQEFYLCVAVSQTGDPTGAYFRYAFSTGANFPDYPKYGVWPDAYYVSTREFDDMGFAGIGAYALDRDQMIAGNPSPQVISFLVTPGATPYAIGDGLLPSDLDGTMLPPAGTPNFYIGSQDNGGPYGAPADALNIWEFHVDFATPANSTFELAGTLPVAAFDSIFPCGPGSRECIPQPGTTQKVDHQGYRQRVLHRAAYRNFGTHESIVTNQSVEASAGISGIRWWEIRDPGSAPTIHQEGTHAPGVTDGIHRWFGSIAQDRQGNMALGYSASSSALFPSIYYTGRLAGDPLGEMTQGEEVFVAGGGSQTSTFARWGDYTSMNVDPVDDCTFWYINEYYPATSVSGWRLHVGAFRFPTCVPAGTLMTYTVQPCRLVDTRLAGGPIPANGSRNFLVAGSPISGQGGAQDCQVPFPEAKAAHLNVVAVSPTGNAHLTVHPYPAPAPLASTLNFTTGQTIANGVLVPICDQDVDLCFFDITVTMGPASAHVVIDVTGYLQPVP